MRYLTLDEVLELHRRVIVQSGETWNIRDLRGLESALAQPRMTFEGRELYPTLAEKAGALAFSLIRNHPFVDGNKRVGHAALETFLILNDYRLAAPLDEQERVILEVAAGTMDRVAFVAWLQEHIVPADAV